MSETASIYRGYRFPPEIISHAVWLYYRFALSYRDVQEMLMERGITVSHEAIRQWRGKFGQDYANRLRRRRPLRSPSPQSGRGARLVPPRRVATTAGGGGRPPD